MNAIETVVANITEYLAGDGKQIIVAYSGGVDSHVMLHSVASLHPKYPQHDFLAVHINHGLQEQANSWEQHCKTQCEALGIPFKSVRVHIDVKSKKGIEAAAREQRYQALINCADHGSIIFLGQHLDDQAETVLLQLKRGAGPKGLSAMPECHQHHSGVIFSRPLLHISREQLVAYASDNHLQWIEDPSNQDSRYDRNFLRHKIMPLLSQRWPGFRQAVARSASLSAQQQALLDEVCDARLQSITDENDSLNIDSLNEYSIAWQHQLVRTWLEQKNVSMPSKAVLDELQQVLNAKQDAEPILQWQEWQFRRFRNKLFCIKHCEALKAGSKIALKHGKLIHPNGFGQLIFSSSATKNVGSIEAHKSVFSEKFKPQDAAMSKPLKQWFKTWDIAPWTREQSLTVTFDGLPVAIWVAEKVIFSVHMPPVFIDKMQWQPIEPAL